jgi:methylthioribose-1-phosphate isomerase
MKLLRPVVLAKNQVLMIDQTELPEEKWLRLNTCEEVADAIKTMKVRGGGAIALAAIYAMVLSAINNAGNLESIKKDAEMLKATRPTAVALFHLIDRMLGIAEGAEDTVDAMKLEANEITKRSIEYEIKIGQYGASLMDDGDTILTHCNAGAMASAGYGGVTLSTFRQCRERGKQVKIIATETRPYLQGARITAFELSKFGFEFKIIPDSAAGFCMQRGMVDKVLVGADRIAANGDVANKVGTYPIAVLAKEHGIPFYVAGSIDSETESGEGIRIEMRDATELLELKGQRIAPEGCDGFYPAFDITPARYVSAIITRQGIVRPPFDFR